MINPQNVPKKKRYGLFVLAIVTLLSGGAALYMGSNNFAIRFLGVVACVVSVYFVRISNVRTAVVSGATSDPMVDSKVTKRPGLIMWIVGVALLALLGIAFLYLYADAQRGYHEILPVYIFAGAATSCALYWAYLVSRTLW